MLSTLITRTVVRRRTILQSTSSYRRWQSSSSSSSTEATSATTSELGPQTQLANIALASSLLGFCGFVFTYSMNAVGRADAEDPLAQLQAEAQDAKEFREKSNARRLSPEEVMALESGRMNVAETTVEVPAVDESPKKKKPWWRFGF